MDKKEIAAQRRQNAKDSVLNRLAKHGKHISAERIREAEEMGIDWEKAEEALNAAEQLRAQRDRNRKMNQQRAAAKKKAKARKKRRS